MKVYRHLTQILTLESAHQKDGRNLIPSDLSLINDGAIVFDEDMIHWVGRDDELPEDLKKLPSVDLSGHVLTPELVDSHTHLVFGGDRAFEYSLRLDGADYQAIAQSGGGILSTMKATIESSEEELFLKGRERVERLHSYGIGTIEIKSGYGLTLESERKLTRVIDRLKKLYAPKVQIFRTYMAAHAVPKNYSSSRQYLDEVVLPLLSEFAEQELIDACDIFHEVGYFSLDDVKVLFKKCQELGVARKIHADEFGDNSGASVAAEFGALSADHLLGSGEQGIKDLAASNTVATLLPGTGFFLGKSQARARDLLNAGAKLALASDYNPGSCHCDNLLLIASISAKTLGLNSAELWCALTHNSAHALGLTSQGVLSPGMKPRFSLFKCPSLSHITYNWGRNFATLLP